MQIRFIFALPLWCPLPPLVPWAAAPVAYPSIHHCPMYATDRHTDVRQTSDVVRKKASLNAPAY